MKTVFVLMVRRPGQVGWEKFGEYASRNEAVLQKILLIASGVKPAALNVFEERMFV